LKIFPILANIIEEEIFFIMRRPITYAELLLILILAPMIWIGGTNLYEFVTDRITVECNFKK
jgi:hypothetical protein|tara:strand:- start:1650 stop:1835 length:186 start_codon:yes stop_codon:yes gene_type:complete